MKKQETVPAPGDVAARLSPGGFRIRHLEIFWAVMRTGSQHEAAKLLGLSQPAVSKLLHHVEDRVGVPLFRRVKGRLIATPQADQFFQAVDEIFIRVGAAERLARDLKRSFSGQITVVAVPGLCASFLPEALGGFLNQYKQVQIAVHILPTAQVVDRVAKHQAELGLLYGPIEAATVQAQTLAEADIVCAVPASHRLAKHASLTPADLAEERLISAAFMPQWGSLFGNAFAEAGLPFTLSVNCATTDFAYGLAAAGGGIAVMPAAPLRADLAGRIVLRCFTPRLAVPVLAVHGGDARLSPTAALLLDWLGRAAPGFAWNADVQPG